MNSIPDSAYHLAVSRQARKADLKLHGGLRVRPGCLRCLEPVSPQAIQLTRSHETITISAWCDPCGKISTYCLVAPAGHWLLVTSWHPAGRPLPSLWRCESLKGLLRFSLWWHTQGRLTV